jgi:hypothetical protein
MDDETVVFKSAVFKKAKKLALKIYLKINN